VKNVLIIGGSYFVGRVFVEELHRRGGWSIHVMNRGNIPIRKEGVTEIVCDRHNTEKARKSLPEKRWHAVVDFCAYTPEDIGGMLTSLQDRHVDRYVYVSTASVYRDSTDLPIGEDGRKLDGPQPELGPFAEYGWNKWRGERKLREICGARGIAHVSVRPAIVYGKYNYAPRESYFFDLILAGKGVVIPEKGLALYSFVSVWDVAAVLISCLEGEESKNRAFNAAGNDLVSYGRLCDVLREVTGRDLSVEEAPLERIERERIPLPFPPDTHLLYANGLSRDVLGIGYTPFVEGMRETWRYYLIGKGVDAP
jgi:2'-hydroxyisoflavone reductase